MSSTEGWFDYNTLLLMEDKERMHWKQKCIDRNEKIQDEINKAKRKGRRR